MNTGFNYLISYCGGIGPDVWDAEMQLSAVDMQDAISQAQGCMEECGGWIVMVSQEDYPPTTREKLEEKVKEIERQRDEAVAHGERMRIAALTTEREVERTKHFEQLCENQKETVRKAVAQRDELLEDKARLDALDKLATERSIAINSLSPRGLMMGYRWTIHLNGIGPVSVETETPNLRSAIDAARKTI